MDKRVGIITQARTTSTRLPEKVLLRANGKTVLQHHLERLTWSRKPVFVATTVNGSDDPIVSIAEDCGAGVFRGDEQDVLGRFYGCATEFQLDVIVRVTSDCPLIDGAMIGKCLEDYIGFNDPNIYYSNCLERTFPRGLDFEIFSFELLKDAYLHAQELFEKEHVTPYINRNRSGKVKLKHFTYREDLSNLRWTLDTSDDWALINKLFTDFKVEKKSFEEIVQIVKAHPELENLNQHIKQKEI